MPLMTPSFCPRLRHLYQVLIWVAAVDLDDVLHPWRRVRGGRLIVRLLKQFDLAAGDRDVQHADFELRRKIGNQRAAKKVSRAKSGVWPTKWRHGGIPIAFPPLRLWKIHRGENLEAL